ncbi:MAG: hypothetical protein IPG93_23050 [Burkholderiales bacterium]|nr:hypothetical protein [Burkholderiales bacterium]
MSRVERPAGGARAAQRARPSALRTTTTATLSALVATALISAVLGGLVRTRAWSLGGVDGPGGAAGLGSAVGWAAVLAAFGDTTVTVLGRAALAHAALVISAFLGTAIGVERAVAIRQPWAFAAPLCSGLAGLCLLAGQTSLAAGLFVLAALVFIAVNIVVVLRQREVHTVLLLLGAVAWSTGNVLFATSPYSAASLPWWFAFLILTIAAERLEMTRLMARLTHAGIALLAVVFTLMAGAVIGLWLPGLGGVIFGLALTALAIWFALFDIARRTVRMRGMSRYMAVCLLVGYAWLAVAGIAWLGTAASCPGRDMALHALGLGFVMSMIMGHAPVILPAVARVKLLFGAWFYVPLVCLHASLVFRLFWGMAEPAWLSLGASLNAASLLLFVLTMIGSAIAWRVQHPVRLAPAAG